MSKINQIQKALLELDGGAFQKLADSYLTRKGYSPLHSIGSVIGKNKTKIGTPDTLITSSNGKYVFVEYTTIAKNKVKAKFADDLRKCFDEKKTSIPCHLISEVILCCNVNIDASEINELQQIGTTAGVNINVFTNSSISLKLLEKFPSVAKDHLGVDVDTGQIVTLDDFRSLNERNKRTTSLNTKFHFRDSEKNLILQSLDANAVTIISGKSGVGKSRLAIECFESFVHENNDFKPYCIYNKSIDIFNDLCAYFSDSGRYLIFVDDANRVSGFQYIIDLLLGAREDQCFKVIVSVRGYALEKILKTCEKISSKEQISINSFTDEELTTLLKEEFGVQNSDYLERILEVSKGNPRIAAMAAKVAVDQNTISSISDVSALYDLYFSSIKSDLNILSDKKILSTAGILAFLGSVDKTSQDHENLIESVFGMKMEEFWDSVVVLHDMEYVDVFENEVAKTSDQILSTYFFYLVFIKEKILSYTNLLQQFFPMYKRRIVDSIDPVLESFNSVSVLDDIKISVDEVWEELTNSGSKDLEEFICLFCFLKPTKTFIYVDGKIDEQSVVEVSIEEIKYDSNTNSSLPSYIEVLANFRNLDIENAKMSVDLLLKYAEKRQDHIQGVLRVLTSDYGFQKNSYRYDYEIELEVTKALISHCKEGKNLFFSKIFLLFAEQYLKTKFSRRSQSDNITIVLTEFQLHETDAIRKIRNLIFDLIFDLYKIDDLRADVRSLLKSNFNNFNNFYDLPSKDIVEKDSDLVLHKLKDYLDRSHITDCILVNDYQNLLIRHNIKFDNAFDEEYGSDSFKMYDLFTNKFEKKEMELPDEEFKEYQRDKCNELVRSLSVSDFDNIFSNFREILDVSGNHDERQLHEGISTALECLSEHDSALYSKVIDSYLSKSDSLNLSPITPVNCLIRSIGREQAFLILSKHTYTNKPTWLLAYFVHIPEAEILIEDLEDLHAIYQTAPSNCLIYWMDFLLKYESLSQGFISTLASTILRRAREDSDFNYTFEALFNPNTDVNNQLGTLFEGKGELLEDIYLNAVSHRAGCDYNGGTLSKLIDANPRFIRKYLESKIRDRDHVNRHDDHTDYSFIWDREDFLEVMQKVSELIFELETSSYTTNYLKKFFDEDVKPQADVNILEKQDEFLRSEIARKLSDIEYLKCIFQVIACFKNDRIVSFFEFLLSKSKDYAVFEHLPIFPMLSSWSGSAVPMHQERLAFIGKLVALCNTVELLHHRQRLEEHVTDIRDSIQRYKKRDFTED